MSSNFPVQNKPFPESHVIKVDELIGKEGLNFYMKRRPHLKTEDASFGKRLARIRKACGLTQAELAERVGLSRRMLAYYEAQSQHIPSASILPALAKALKCSSDQLLGLKNLKIKEPGVSMKLQSKLNIIPKLPRKQRKAVLDYAQALYRDQQKQNQ